MTVRLTDETKARKCKDGLRKLYGETEDRSTRTTIHLLLDTLCSRPDDVVAKLYDAIVGE